MELNEIVSRKTKRKKELSTKQINLNLTIKQNTDNDFDEKGLSQFHRLISIKRRLFALDLELQVEIFIAKAKLLDWMGSFSEMELPRMTRKQKFQWMEHGIIPYWMFLEYEKNEFFDVHDEAYFDEYNTYQKPVPSQYCSHIFGLIYKSLYFMTSPKCPIIPFSGMF